MSLSHKRPHAHADLAAQRFYWYRIRIPRWLFVLAFGEPGIRLPPR